MRTLSQHFSHHLSEASSPYIFGVNMGVLGIVTMAEVESVLKIAVLSVTLLMTCLSIWLKWRDRDKKPND